MTSGSLPSWHLYRVSREIGLSVQESSIKRQQVSRKALDRGRAVQEKELPSSHPRETELKTPLVEHDAFAALDSEEDGMLLRTSPRPSSVLEFFSQTGHICSLRYLQNKCLRVGHFIQRNKAKAQLPCHFFRQEWQENVNYAFKLLCPVVPWCNSIYLSPWWPPQFV